MPSLPWSMDSRSLTTAVLASRSGFSSRTLPYRSPDALPRAANAVAHKMATGIVKLGNRQS